MADKPLAMTMPKQRRRFRRGTRRHLEFAIDKLIR
jgi:hypothetical protein